MKWYLKKTKINNAGTTLVEILAVIAIMSILTGGVAYGTSLIFSKDAAQCATKINDALYETRMSAMSKAGKYTISVDTVSGINIATITSDEEGVDPVVIYLDGGSNLSKTIVTAKMIDESGNETGLNLPVIVEFDKAKGCVKSVNDGSGLVNCEGIICYDIAPKKGDKPAKVQLITSTGKHTIGDFR